MCPQPHKTSFRCLAAGFGCCRRSRRRRRRQPSPATALIELSGSGPHAFFRVLASTFSCAKSGPRCTRRSITFAVATCQKRRRGVPITPTRISTTTRHGGGPLHDVAEQAVASLSSVQTLRYQPVKLFHPAQQMRAGSTSAALSSANGVDAAAVVFARVARLASPAGDDGGGGSRWWWWRWRLTLLLLSRERLSPRLETTAQGAHAK